MFFLDYIISRPFVWGYQVKSNFDDFANSTFGSIILTISIFCLGAELFGFWKWLLIIICVIFGIIILFSTILYIGNLWEKYCEDKYKIYKHKIELFFMPTVYLRRNRKHHSISFFTKDFDGTLHNITTLDTRYFKKDFLNSDLYIKLDLDGKRLINKWIKGGFIEINE